jgi:large subunit ribosomal protein L31
MKTGIHPKYEAQSFTCSCGNVIDVRATIPGQGIEICSNCHPFYTGKQKILDSAGRIERFTSRYQTIVGAKRKTRSAPKEGPKDAAKEAPKAE